MREKGRVKMVQVARIASPLVEYPILPGTESQHLPFLRKVFRNFKESSGSLISSMCVDFKQ
jgi:hypothetical protein